MQHALGSPARLCGSSCDRRPAPHLAGQHAVAVGLEVRLQRALRRAQPRVPVPAVRQPPATNNNESVTIGEGATCCDEGYASHEGE
jgi:hypothetical protein